MQILISCAKTMGHTAASVPRATVPRFEKEAHDAVRQILQLPAGELEAALHVNARIAAENRQRYAAFFDDATPSVPALLAYTGIVFRYIDPASFTADDFEYAAHHLFITSFLYGLLRPLDAIRPYRLEGNVCLPDADGPARFDYWQPRLTQYLIDSVKADDGVLVNLASGEMKRLFDWRRVYRELRVVKPDFKTIREGRERSVVVYTKMCRGQMTSFILRNRLTLPEELAHFEPDVAEAPVVMHLDGV